MDSGDGDGVGFIGSVKDVFDDGFGIMIIEDKTCVVGRTQISM